MNKKFLSAILFGALMVTSTGTFVSCKDYDDDIKDLQTQINSNKDAIAALQKLVGEGNWVTGITSIADGFTVTMSNGQTTTITAIKGADGKDGVEWTIGEDGFWYKDGEKTTHQAVAEDGKPGVTAPSPSISADGKWVVYEWDATKGEFVAKTTEIPAQGTSAYVVKKDGVYVLHIADETGAFQDVTLPATSDSFVVEAPYKEVRVKYETATWNKWNANKEESKTLLKKYPELAEIAKNTPMQQGGNLPILITPANVELSDDFSFSLQTVAGKIADVEVSAPVKGLPANTTIASSTIEVNGETITLGKYMLTRAASDDCFWTVKAEPAYDEKEKAYAEANDVSLVVTNPAGTVVKTAFAYSVISEAISGDVNVSATNNSAEYASSIDVFTAQKEGDSPIFTVKNDYAGKYVLELTNNLQVEKYDLSVDGSKIVIGNMPANENSITIDVKVTVLGLNGSVASASATITVSQGVDASVSLKPQAVTLAEDPVEVRWNMAEDLNMSAVQLDQLMKGEVKFFISRVDDDTQEKFVAYDGAVKFYDAKKKEVEYNNGKWYIMGTTTESAAVTFGLDVDAATLSATTTTIAGDTYTAEMWMPKEYTVRMTSTNGTTVVFSAETTLTVSNPAETATATYIKLAPAFVENNVYQITGSYTGTQVTYALKDAIVMGKNATLLSFVDLDAKNYIENGGDDTDETEYDSYNWLSQTQKIVVNNEGELDATPAANATLYVNKWQEIEAGDETPAAKVQQLYHERNMCAYYYLFGNAKNIIPFPFKIKVKSAIYSDTPEKVIIMDATKLTAIFDQATPKNRQIDIKEAITKALVAAGTDRGQEYDLYSTAGGKTKYDDYASGPAVNGEYVVTSAGKPIAIKADDLMSFGMTMDQYIAYTSSSSKPTYYLKMNTVVYYNNSEYASMREAAISTLSDEDKDELNKIIEAEETIRPKAIEIKGWSDLYSAYMNNYVLNAAEGKYELIYDSVDEIDSDEAVLISLFNSYNSLTVFAQKESINIQNASPYDSRLEDEPVVSFADVAEAAKYFVFDNTTVNSDGELLKHATTITAKAQAPADITSGEVTVPMKLTVIDKWGMTMVREFNVVVTTD